MRFARIAISSAVVISLCGMAAAADKKFSRAKLPSAVFATIDRETKGATIMGYASEVEGGHLIYEVETPLRGHATFLSIPRSGTLLEGEKELTMSTLPSVGFAGIIKKAAETTIEKVEPLTQRGVLVTYEASISRDGKKGEVQVGPLGQSLERAE